MKKMGGMSSILKMLPGMGGSQLSALEDQIDESQMQRTEAIILSMTPKERSNPDILNQSRKIRIAKGAGVDISEVNILVKQFDQARKLMKQFGGKMGGKRPLEAEDSFDVHSEALNLCAGHVLTDSSS